MIPRTIFSSDHELFRDSVRKFLEQQAVPFHAQWEKDGHVDRALWTKAARLACSVRTFPRSTAAWRPTSSTAPW